VCPAFGTVSKSPGEPSQSALPVAGLTRLCRTWTVASPGVSVLVEHLTGGEGDEGPARPRFLRIVNQLRRF
jgi:hypothetical protein